MERFKLLATRSYFLNQLLGLLTTSGEHLNLYIRVWLSLLYFVKNL